ncbi:MAG: serine/threonine-protein kinase, partial [Planctomycetota bacterium]
MQDNPESDSFEPHTSIGPERLTEPGTSPTSQPSPDDDRQDLTTPDGASVTKVTDFGKSVSGESFAEKIKKPLPFKQLGKYELIEEIGQGGMGVVYRAHEPELDREVALKILPAQNLKKKGQADRFSLEAKAAASLNHEHIVPIYDSGEDEGTRYYAMKLIEGQPLSIVVKSARQALRSGNRKHLADSNATIADRAASVDTKASKPKLSETSFVASHVYGDSKSHLGLAKSVARIGIDAAQALHHAHLRGVIHRDIKPSNLLLDEDHKVWITDFGLAQLRNSPSLTQTGDIVGTLRYMSPEQASGRRSFVDNRTDIYSLGITLYELLTLRSACRGRDAAEILREVTFERPIPIRKLNSHVPKDLESIIERAIERNPDDRYENAVDFANDLQRFVDGEKPSLKRYGVWKRTRDWLTTRPAALASIGVGVLCLLLTLGAIAWAYAMIANDEEKQKEIAQAQLIQAENAELLARAAYYRKENPSLAIELLRQIQGGPAEALNRTILSVLPWHRELQQYRRAVPNFSQIFPTGGNSNLALVCYRSSETLGLAAPKIYDLAAKRELAELNSSDAITSGQFHPQLPYMVTSGSNFQHYGKPLEEATWETSPIVIWDSQSFELQRTLRDYHSIRLTPQSFGSQSGKLVLLHSSNRCKVIQLSPFEEIGPELIGHTGKVTQAIFSPDERLIGTVAFDNTIRIWDASNGQVLATYPISPREPAKTRLEFSSDSRYLLAAGNGSYLVDTQNLESPVRSLAAGLAKFSSNNERLFLVSRFGQDIREYDIETAKILRTLNASSFISDIDTSKDGRYLIASVDRTTEIFDLRSKAPKSYAYGHDNLIADIVCLTDNQRFCT